MSARVELDRPPIDPAVVSPAGGLDPALLRVFLELARAAGGVAPGDVTATIKYWIAEIDRKLGEQVDEVLHAPAMQALEATWRGLHYLVFHAEVGPKLKVRVLNATRRELLRDLEKAGEWDQSALFKKVYEEEYGQLGGEPYGLLIGDYTISRQPEDISLLQMIAGVAAAAHAPFVAAADPGLLGMKSIHELTLPRDLSRIFAGVEYTMWKAFRDTEDSRYTALTLPRVLARLPYGVLHRRVREFCYEENVDGPSDDRYVWMSAVWPYAVCVAAAYTAYGWFARTQGMEAGGRVEGLPVHAFSTDARENARKCSTRVLLSDEREHELSSLGLLPLLQAKNRDFVVFLSAQSCQAAKQYSDTAASASAELSAKISYILCVSRFAHYLKVIARDKIGSGMEAAECQRQLNEWIMNYVVGNPENASDETRARKPLSAASVKVRPVAGKPGSYEAVAWLRPHFQLEAVKTSMRLVAEVPRRS